MSNLGIEVRRLHKIFRKRKGLLRGRRSVYYGWWVLAAGTVAMALGSGLSMSAFGLYVKPLEQEFGWDRAQVSLGFSAASTVRSPERPNRSSSRRRVWTGASSARSTG